MDRTEKVQSEQLEQALAGALPRQGQGGRGLDPLVELAVEVREALMPPAPSAAFATGAKTHLANRLARPARPAVRRAARPLPAPRRIWQPALAGLILVVTLLGGGLGVAYAAADALPGEALYGAKRGLEQLQLALTSTPGSQASLRARFASERLQEAEALLAAGRETEANGLLTEYQSEITEMIGLAQQSSDAERVQGLQQALAAQQQALTRFLERSSDAGQQAVGDAIEEARHSQAVLETLLQGGSPSDLAPGQLRRSTETSDPGNGHGRGHDQGGGRRQRTPTPEIP